MRHFAITALLMWASAAHAADLDIASFAGNVEVTWTFPTNGVDTYRVEWASALAPNEWSDMGSGIRGLAPTGNTMVARVPMFYRIKALGPNPPGMVYIPAGRFDMGDTFNEGDSDELPVHSVYVSGFYIDSFEVTTQLWGEVHTWALTNGYAFSHPGTGTGAGEHPVHTISWYDAVKWCNARSAKDGLTPCYYADAAFSNLYKTGDVAIENAWVNWRADGYRLPTEAEWEKAARGGLASHRFPWGDNTISHGRANYDASGGEPYDLSNGSGYHPDVIPFTNTTHVGRFTANAYGVYATAGNLREWCWDRHSSGYYSSSPGSNPRGPVSGSTRVLRGGAWRFTALYARSASRVSFGPDAVGNYVGFRTVRGL